MDNDLELEPIVLDYGMEDASFDWFDPELERELLEEDRRSCVAGSLSSIQHNVLISIAFALIQRLIVTQGFLGKYLTHGIVSLLGVALLYEWNLPLPVVSAVALSATVVTVSLRYPGRFREQIGYFVTISALFSLAALELSNSGSEFSSYRGVIMILAMKMSSVAFDISDGDPLEHPLVILSYFLNPATILFGPAIPLRVYRTSLGFKGSKSEFSLLIWAALSLGVSLSCMLVSSCFTELYFPSVGLARNFADAQSFRFSHYFISFWSYGLSCAAGMSFSSIVSPFKVEIPRSLTEVVTVWNVPMHQYLFKYVYSRTRHLGSSVGILSTFAVSSLFHGLNGQLSAVLLSLGFLSWAENRLRNRLSHRLSLCCRSRECSVGCGHAHSGQSLRGFTVNLLWTCLAVYHLIYLGMPWNHEMSIHPGSSLRHALSVWKSHHFASHILGLFTALLSFCL